MPNANAHRPDTDYLESLIADSGMTKAAICSRLGISYRRLCRYLTTGSDHIDCPYTVQYCLESLAREGNQ